MLKRTSFKPKVPAPESTPMKGPRKVKCRNCRSLHTGEKEWCSDDCAVELALSRVAKQKLKKARAERAETKAKLAQYETIPELKARLQTVFNLFCRLRDDLAGYPCICCGKWPLGDASLTGGQWDACHWKGRGAHDHLRFNEDNVHRGLKDCNKYGHTDYRGGLIKRIGIDRVEAMEANHAVVKWTRDGLLAMIAEYSAKVKQLKKDSHATST